MQITTINPATLPLSIGRTFSHDRSKGKPQKKTPQNGDSLSQSLWENSSHNFPARQPPISLRRIVALQGFVNFPVGLSSVFLDGSEGVRGVHFFCGSTYLGPRSVSLSEGSKTIQVSLDRFRVGAMLECSNLTSLFSCVLCDPGVLWSASADAW